MEESNGAEFVLALASLRGPALVQMAGGTRCARRLEVGCSTEPFGFINKYDPHSESRTMFSLELLWEPVQEWNFLIGVRKDCLKYRK